jgi:hypothetical protein
MLFLKILELMGKAKNWWARRIDQLWF